MFQFWSAWTNQRLQESVHTCLVISIKFCHILFYIIEGVWKMAIYQKYPVRIRKLCHTIIIVWINTKISMHQESKNVYSVCDIIEWYILF